MCISEQIISIEIKSGQLMSTQVQVRCSAASAGAGQGQGRCRSGQSQGRSGAVGSGQVRKVRSGRVRSGAVRVRPGAGRGAGWVLVMKTQEKQ